MLRRTAIKSIVLAALGVVWKKKPEVFVVETPDGYISGEEGVGYIDTDNENSWKPLPPGRWKLTRIVFEKVGG